MFVADFFAGIIFYFLLSEQRSSYGEHRCVTHLYHIPLGIFDCVMGKAVLPKLFANYIVQAKCYSVQSQPATNRCCYTFVTRVR